MPINTKTIPAICSPVIVSGNSQTDTLTATGSSIALKIDARPPPTFGTAIDNSKIGKIIPNKPRIRPYFHKPPVS